MLLFRGLSFLTLSYFTTSSWYFRHVLCENYGAFDNKMTNLVVYLTKSRNKCWLWRHSFNSWRRLVAGRYVNVKPSIIKWKTCWLILRQRTCY